MAYPRGQRGAAGVCAPLLVRQRSEVVARQHRDGSHLRRRAWLRRVAVADGIPARRSRTRSEHGQGLSHHPAGRAFTASLPSSPHVRGMHYTIKCAGSRCLHGDNTRELSAQQNLIYHWVGELHTGNSLVTNVVCSLVPSNRISHTWRACISWVKPNPRMPYMAKSSSAACAEEMSSPAACSGVTSEGSCGQQFNAFNSSEPASDRVMHSV